MLFHASCQKVSSLGIERKIPEFPCPSSKAPFLCHFPLPSTEIQSASITQITLKKY
jgi:hypothetical protein